QRRDLAILRILGSEQRLLFSIVVVEVLVIGIIGVGLGIVLGQAITAYLVVPFIESQMSQEGLTPTITPAISFVAILPAIISAFVVLGISALKPAQDASRTKVLHAINPGVADNIQLEDLDQLRERRSNMGLFYIGLGLLSVVVMLFSLILADTFDNPVVSATIILANLLLMVVGLVFVFFIFTRPLEKLILTVIGLVSPRLTYFAIRNVGRSTERNTLISLLVLFSGVLPSFLATQSAIDRANIETNVRLDMGAPVSLERFSRSDNDEDIRLSRLRPSFVSEELPAVSGIDQAVGLTYAYSTNVADVVGTRTGQLSLVGVVGDLNTVLYEDQVVFTAGGPDSLRQILNDPSAVIISQGMAEGLAVPLGGTIKITGQGIDHEQIVTVVGIVQRLPGFEQIGRIRSQSLAGDTVLISLEGFQRLITDPKEALPFPNDPILDRVLATLDPEADPEEMRRTLRDTFRNTYDFRVELVDVALSRAQSNEQFEQTLLLVMTSISFITAVFGVFAVIYVTIYARRMEIGMMKAVGARNWELNGMLSVESIAMTVSAALAGILAGATMGYIFSYIESATAQRPQQFTVDTTVMPFIIVLVVFASILATMFSARRIIRRKAVEILRMS
ncbi:MAG: ABC transporter permease, partial [Chloroflexota bacterium]